MTMISLMINSFFGCCWRFICLMATSWPVATSDAVYTVPEAPWPIFSILLYFLVGSPTLTICLSCAITSASDIFCFLSLLWVAAEPGVCWSFSLDWEEEEGGCPVWAGDVGVEGFAWAGGLRGAFVCVVPAGSFLVASGRGGMMGGCSAPGGWGAVRTGSNGL